MYLEICTCINLSHWVYNILILSLVTVVVNLIYVFFFFS